MRDINLISLTQAHDSLKEEDFKSFLMLHGTMLKKGEIDDLTSLVNEIENIADSITIFDAFYIGFKIPQIGKEFDLLRFSDETIINIELKKTCTKERAREQLIRNQYYLRFTGRTVQLFTYISDDRKLYKLDDKLKLTQIDMCDLVSFLEKQLPKRSENIDDLFDPSDYLVSPFNSVKRFLKGEYFLTHQQEEFKGKILQIIRNPRKANIISVTGSAGTGKTLLTYDIAKELNASGHNLVIIHCGYLNDGQVSLNDHGWKIIEIKNFRKCKLADYETVIIDEAQRIQKEQLDFIIKQVTDADLTCILSYDKVQTLSTKEERADIAAEIKKIATLSFSLSEKIRTNKEIADFIKALFNNKRNHILQNKKSIEISYFNNTADAKSYLSKLDNSEWEVIRFTPSQYNAEHHEKYFSQAGSTSHQVIGQEFDGVAIAIDHYFGYDANGDLHYKGRAYYHVAKMLFQNITRARKRLKLVIINNKEVLSRCISILQ